MFLHFVGKNIIDDLIKRDASLLAKTTFLWNPYYASNLKFPMFKPNFVVRFPAVDLCSAYLLTCRLPTGRPVSPYGLLREACVHSLPYLSERLAHIYEKFESRVNGPDWIPFEYEMKRVRELTDYI